MAQLVSGSVKPRCLNIRSTFTGVSSKTRRPHRVAASSHTQYRVLVTKVPLVGIEAVTGALGPLYPRHLMHSVTLVVSADGECRAYDFLPEEPESPAVLLAMLSGAGAEAELRSRPLKRVPSYNTRPVGECTHPDGFQAAKEFNRSYPRRIRLFHNDCRTHTNLLVAHLTGVQGVLDSQ